MRLPNGGDQVPRRELRDTNGSMERTCIVTRKKGSPEGMIRFVIGPGQIVVPDIRRRLPGRGVWVMAHAELVTKAVKGQAFSRSFKTKAIASDKLSDEIEVLLTKDCLEALSLANKAGQVITGFAKVEEAIANAALAGLIHAADCGADGRRKLGERLHRRYSDAEAVPRIDLFQSGQLDLALGRTNVVHAALVEGAASQGFLDRCRKLTLFRSAWPRGGGTDRQPVAASSGSLDGLPALRHAETKWAGTLDL